MPQELTTMFLRASIIGVSVVFVGAAIAFIVWQRQLGKHRGVRREDFIQTFTRAGIPVEVSAAVYDYYRRSAISREFSVAPGDDYKGVLLKGEEDIDDDAGYLMKKLGFKIPAEYARARSETTISTLRDMVIWLDWVGRQQPPNPGPAEP